VPPRRGTTLHLSEVVGGPEPVEEIQPEVAAHRFLDHLADRTSALELMSLQ
jgi:hypothetical protein